MVREWVVFEKAFSPDACDTLIALCNMLPKENANIGPAGTTVNDDYRKSDIAFIQVDNTKFSGLFDSLWKLIWASNSQFFDFHISKLDFMQYAEYTADKKSEYKKHQDVFWINNAPYYHRKLTAVLQLSDETAYEGGNLEFYDLNENPDNTIVRKQGSLIIFPSFYYHCVTPVTKGKRESITAWVDGPKWR